MGGLILGLLLGGGLGLWLLIRQRKDTRALTAQVESFLDGSVQPLKLSLEEGPDAALQNAIARLQNQLLLSREQTHLETLRSTNLLTDISHQLKTPLSSLQLFLELDNGPHLEQEQAQILRMQTLIANLLRLERLCADGYTFHFAVMDLQELAESCWQPLGALYPEKIFLCHGTARLYCDEIWLGEALTNLFKNACEHTAPAGHIRLCLAETPQEVQLILSDDGGGVDPQTLPRLFERFYHGNHPGHGAGIGLAIVKEIIWRHHGSIQAQNIPGGLQFTLFFPKLDHSLTKS